MSLERRNLSESFEFPERNKALGQQAGQKSQQAEDTWKNGLIGTWAMFACDNNVLEMKEEVQMVPSVLFLSIPGNKCNPA